jgi:hypothetical protein
LALRGGIVVTPIGVQQGGEIIAKYEGIDIVHLDADSTTTDFVMKFLEKVVAGVSAKLSGSGTLTAEARVLHRTPERDNEQ